MARPAKNKHNRRNKFLVLGLVSVVIIALIGWSLSRLSIPVLQPAGPVAAGERRLLIVAFLLMLLVVIPVFALTFGIAWRYRETNPKKTTYKPDWDHSRLAETIWWLLPSALIAVLAVITWHGTFRYDPYKTLDSSVKPVTVQVIALDWRWLFIYPEQHIASINKLYLPVNTPINFQITADAPMNSFWIPQLGGQVYAMPGMNTELHLMADRLGSFDGRSANISGKGFAGMHFKAVSVSESSFRSWTASTSKQSPLTQARYDSLATASTDQGVYAFSKPATDLYDTIVAKYMFVDGMNMGEM